jgi:hypothetical protein
MILPALATIAMADTIKNNNNNLILRSISLLKRTFCEIRMRVQDEQMTVNACELS